MQPFQTIVTTLSPLKSNGIIIHPAQDRFITVREAARAQSFPDSFHFSADRKSALKQVPTSPIYENLTHYFKTQLKLISDWKCSATIACQSHWYRNTLFHEVQEIIMTNFTNIIFLDFSTPISLCGSVAATAKDL
jgi:C-5 cytosine-specific DNA methylase